MLTVGIADDHPVTLLGLAHGLNGFPGARVVSQSHSVEALLTDITKYAFDVAIVDPCMHGAGDITLLRLLRQRHPSLRVIFFCREREDKLVQRLSTVAGCACVSKRSPSKALLRALNVMCVEVRLSRNPLPPLEEAPSSLSEIENNVVRLIAQGLSVSAIALSFGRSIKTISTHKVNAQRKLGVDGTVALVRRWQHTGGR